MIEYTPSENASYDAKDKGSNKPPFKDTGDEKFVFRKVSGNLHKVKSSSDNISGSYIQLMNTYIKEVHVEKRRIKWFKNKQFNSTKDILKLIPL